MVQKRTCASSPRPRRLAPLVCSSPLDSQQPTSLVYSENHPRMTSPSSSRSPPASPYGMFFAIPLRKFYILKEKLVFPQAVAAAHTIRALHAGKHAEANTRTKTTALMVAFSFAIILRCVSEYAPGILWDWHWSWTAYPVGWKGIIGAESRNWVWEWTPAFIAVGMLTGVNASYSILSGSVLAWGVIGPSIVATGLAFGEPVSPLYRAYTNYNNMVLEDAVNKPSPRYWLVW